MVAEEIINQVVSDILIEQAYESIEPGYDEISDFKANLKRNIKKALEIKEREHLDKLREIREEFQFAKNVQKHKHPGGYVQAIDIDTVFEILDKHLDDKK